MSLSHQDVQDILRQLDDTHYDELTLETARYTLTLRRNGNGWTQETTTVSSPKSQVASVASTKPVSDLEEPAPTETGLVDIRASMVGTFYRASKPGAESFVDIDSHVKDNTVIGIIEVMKLMNSIAAGVSGEIVEILVDDAQFVDKGQLLMRVRPAK